MDKQELEKYKEEVKRLHCLIYCVAYDKTCITGNDCKQEHCVFKERLLYKKALDKIDQLINTVAEQADTQCTNTKYLHEFYLSKIVQIREVIDGTKFKKD